MDEILNSAVDTACALPGTAVRYSLPHSPGLWHDIAEVHDGRLAVAVGSSTDPALATRLRSEVGSVLRATGDPVAALQTAADSTAGGAGMVALCAVIDRPTAQLTYSSVGDLQLVVTSPDTAHTVLGPAVGRPAFGWCRRPPCCCVRQVSPNPPPGSSSRSRCCIPSRSPTNSSAPCPAVPSRCSIGRRQDR